MTERLNRNSMQWGRGRGVPTTSIRRLLLPSGAALVLGISAGSAAAAESAPKAATDATPNLRVAQAETADRITLDIPAQPLDPALTTLADRAGLTLLYTSDAVAGMRTPGLAGTYTPVEALEALLSGTGLAYRFTGADTVTLVEVGDQDREPLELAPITVESALRTETPVDELTRSVTVVTNEQVQTQKRIDRSIGELMANQVPGFSPSTEANTNFAQTLRGRTFLTLIDGVPQTMPLRDGRRALNSIDSEAIEQVEVVRGGTALYGFGAQGGLVNIVTKRPDDGALHVNASAGTGFSATQPGGSYDGTGNLGVSGRTGRFDYLANGTFVSRGGRFDADGDRIPPDPTGIQGGLADTDTWNFVGKAGLQIDENQRVQLSGLYYDLEQDTEFAGISFAGDPDTGRKTPAVRGDAPIDPGTENRNVSLEYTNDDLWGSSLSTQLYYAELGVSFGKFPGFEQSLIESEKFGGRLTVESPIPFEPLPFTLTWGMDALADTTDTTTFGEGASAAAPKLDQSAFAGFAQVEVPIADLGLLSGGVRHEVIDVDAPDFLQEPSGNLVEGGTVEFDETVYNVSATVFVTDSLDLYGGFSQSFNITELGRVLATFPFARAEDAESEAEVVDNWELGLRYTTDQWDASIVGFYSKSDGGVSFDQNLDIVKAPERIWGVEVTANYQVMAKLRLGGTFTWMDSRVDLDDDGDFEEELPATRVPPAKLTAYAEYSPFDWWHARLQALYSADQDQNSTQFGGTRDIDDYIVFDLYNAFDVGPGELQVGVENLFNNDYTPVISQAFDLSFAFTRAPGTRITAAYAIEF